MRTLLLALLFVPGLGSAQEPAAAPPAPPPAQEKQEKTDAQKFQDAVKDLTKVEGAFTLYRRKGEVLLELPEDRLGRLFYVQATVYQGFGGPQSGDPLNAYGVDVYRLERDDDTVWLVQPQLRHRWRPEDPLGPASQLTFPAAKVLAFKVEQKDPEKKRLLLNVSDLFFGQAQNVSLAVSLGTQTRYSLDRERSGPVKMKAFDDRTVVRMGLTFTAPNPEATRWEELAQVQNPAHLQDRRSAPLEVTYTLWYQKPTGYVARFSDPRVGYFTEDFYGLDRFYRDDRTVRLINRFRLKKKDPAAALSEPVEPITWWIDPSVPEEFREGVRRGILMWNPAFEKAGFKDALVVKEAPKDDPDWDHADGRHNLVRWVMSRDAAYGVAFFRPDPLTGEILNAAVTIDANYPAFVLRELKYDVNPLVTREQRLAQTTTRVPDPCDDHRHQEERDRALAKAGWRTSPCSYAEGAAERAATGWALLQAMGQPIDQKEYMTQFVADLVAHEIGHCLGLRHNFAASTHLSTAELADEAKVATEGVAASTMDYIGVNVPAILARKKAWFNRVVGRYDQWAIEYGYRESGASKPEDEVSFLAQIARRSGEPGHAYLTDEDADGVNPLAVRYDLARDPLVWLGTEFEANRRVRAFATDRLTRQGESYHVRTGILLRTLVADVNAARRVASRYVGGVEFRRQFRGDVQERPTLAPVSPADQRAAMKLIVDRCLRPGSLQPAPGTLTNLSPDPDSGQGGFWTAPVRERMTAALESLVGVLLSAGKAATILENEVKATQPYRLTEHYRSVTDAVFEDLAPRGEVGAVRRDLHRFALDALLRQAQASGGGLSDDVRLVAQAEIDRVGARIQAALAPGGPQTLTQLHLRDMLGQIARYRERRAMADR